MGDVARIERVGGHHAIDFVNTLGGLPEAPDDEYLFSYADLVTFAAGSGLLDPLAAARLRHAAMSQPERAGEVLDASLTLRSCLDRVLRARLMAQPPSSRDLDAVRQAYLASIAHATLRQGREHYDWAWPAVRGTLDEPLSPLAFHAVELLRAAPLHRLTRCGHCRWLVLDLSKNRSRRWCSMNACGSITKMRRYRAARRHSTP